MKLITTSFLVLLALLNTISFYSQTVVNNSKVVMSEADITSLARTLKKYKKTKINLTENTHSKQQSEHDNSYEIEYLRYRLTQLENQQNNIGINRNNNQDNENEITAMHNEILQLKSLLINQKLSSENNYPNAANTDSKATLYTKKDVVNTANKERFNQPDNAEFYKNNDQEKDLKIRAMENKIFLLQSLLDNQKLNTTKSEEIKIVYAENPKRERQSNIQYTTEPTNSELKVDELTELSRIIKEQQLNSNNANIDSIQKQLLEIKNSIIAKDTIVTIKELSKKYNPSASGFANYRKQLFFETNKKELDLNQVTILDELALILANNDNIDVFIKGFASNKGNPVYNENLSLQRTESVKKMLVSKGIHPTRILTQYHGIDYESKSDDLARRVDIELLIRKQ